MEANAFEMIPQLVSLDLSHCEIKRVAAKAFNQIEALEKLYINNNQIKEIKQKTVDTIRGKTIIATTEKVTANPSTLWWHKYPHPGAPLGIEVHSHLCQNEFLPVCV